MVVEQAKKLGIKRVFLINPNSSVSSTSTSIAEYMDGEKPRIVFDCNGSALSNELAINVSYSQRCAEDQIAIAAVEQSNEPILTILVVFCPEMIGLSGPPQKLKRTVEGVVTVADQSQ